MKLTPMHELVLIGGFRELGGDPDQQEQWPSILDYVSESPQENEDRVVSYLRSARGIAGRSGVEFDVLDPSNRIPMAVSMHTDGVYIWESTLAFYVEKYHVRLPDDFLRHAASANWKPPEVKLRGRAVEIRDGEGGDPKRAEPK